MIQISYISLVIGIVLIMFVGTYLKRINAEYSTLLTMGACLLIMIFVIGKITGIFEFVERISSYINLDVIYIEIVLKMIGISYICEFGANICKDAGYNAVAAQIEMAGKVTLLLMSIPILVSVFDLIAEMTG